MPVLNGRVAIVSGASAGIGRACAQRYAEEGASVVICARRMDRLEALSGEIAGGGGRAIPVQCDVGDAEDIKRVVETAIREFGRVDILANIAQGEMHDHVYLPELTPERVVAAINTGPIQSLLFMQACLPHMRKQNYGRIINTGSHVGDGLHPGFSALSIAKAAMVPLTRMAAKEWGQYGITTNLFMPLMLNEASGMTEQGRKAFESLAATNPMGRIGSPYEDCTPLLVFLASEGADYINGQTIGVDGGNMRA
jgi:3-oxoacyl-[acyl-carrier protein] reductase